MMFLNYWRAMKTLHIPGTTSTAAVLAFFLILVAHPICAQVVPSADAGGIKIWAGGAVSGFKVHGPVFSDRNLAGITALVDVDTNRGFGLEGEARWLDFHQVNNLHVETYSIGGRYHHNLGRFQPYAKGLIGFGDFNFPYNYAHGRYAVYTMGGGIDYLWKHRITIRAADLEYQYWPQFTFGTANTMGISIGARVRVF
jgi:hypothetical protein